MGRWKESAYNSEMLICVNDSVITGRYGDSERAKGTTAKKGFHGQLTGALNRGHATGEWTETFLKNGRRS